MEILFLAHLFGEMEPGNLIDLPLWLIILIYSAIPLSIGITYLIHRFTK